MIAAGMWLFGPDNPFGWRFGAALTGTLSIFLLALIAQKLFRSLTLGAVAGVLLAVDGHHLVMSRTSLLDIFLMFWVLAAFGALLMDRDDGRRRLAARLGRQAAASAAGRPSALQLTSGPWLGIRWWRLAAGVCLGLAVGTKWSALFFLAAFGLLTVFWDLSARRIAGVHGWISGGILKDGVAGLPEHRPGGRRGLRRHLDRLVPVHGRLFPALGRSQPLGRVGLAAGRRPVPGPLPPGGLQVPSGPERGPPVRGQCLELAGHGPAHVLFLRIPQAGHPGLRCQQLHHGHPLGGQPAYLVGRRPLPAASCCSGGRGAATGAPARSWPGVAAGYLPWFMYPERTMFFFYAVSFEPFLVLALVYCLGLVLGQRTDPPVATASGFYVVALFVVGGRAAVRVLLPGLDRRGDPLPAMALPDVDAFLDLGQDCRGSPPDSGRTRNGDAAVREASTGLLVELDPGSNVTDLLLEQHAKDPVHALYSRKGPGGWTDVSAQQFLDQVTALAKGLIAGGLAPGETVAVMSSDPV